MSKFKIDNRTLALLHAQVNLSETFNHTLRSAPRREALAFRLKVERNKADTHFTVELGSERHTLTLTNSKKCISNWPTSLKKLPMAPPTQALHLSR